MRFLASCAEPYGQGIVNAQLSVLKGLEAAKRHGYTFVVPPMVQWWAYHDPSYILILPFSHFYNQEHFESFADEYGALPPSCQQHFTGMCTYPPCKQHDVRWLLPEVLLWLPVR